MNGTPDTIEKTVLLKAPPERVWRAIADAKAFGTWFGMEFEGEFVAGRTIAGRVVPTKVDPAVAERQKPYEGFRIELQIERIEPMTLFSFRWHPDAVGEGDLSNEPTTLVSFSLEPAPDGTTLHIRESGFNQIPLKRRAEAFGSNDGGWSAQAGNIEKYLALAPR